MPYAVAKQYAPTPLPDRIVLSWSEAPATTMDITYRTAEGVSPASCQWIVAETIRGDHRDGDIPGSELLEGISEPFESDLGTCQIHTIRLRGLAPATKYAYRVGDGVNWSAWNHFTTASDQPEPFEFLYFGDAQNAVRALWSRVRREAHSEAPRAAFALHAGDLINHADSDGEWGEWHEAAGWLNATVPTVATPGNHEYSKLSFQKKISKHWRPQFSLPTNGPKGLEESCYWFEYQGVRFVSLNSNVRIEEQAVWFDQLLSGLPPARWTIATFHHPVYSAAIERDNDAIRKAWKPLFDKHGVHLALQGHDHAYARSGLGGPEATVENVGDGVRRQSGQTVYVVSVSGPKNYVLGETWDVSRAGSGIQLYQTIRVEEKQIHYRAYLAAGELYDAFILEKGEGGAMRLIEQVPDSPEIKK